MCVSSCESADGPHGVEIKAFKVKKAVPRANRTMHRSSSSSWLPAPRVSDSMFRVLRQRPQRHDGYLVVRQKPKRTMRRFLISGVCALAMASACMRREVERHHRTHTDLSTNFSSIQQTIFNASDSSGRLSCVGATRTRGVRRPPISC